MQQDVFLNVSIMFKVICVFIPAGSFMVTNTAAGHINPCIIHGALKPFWIINFYKPQSESFNPSLFINVPDLYSILDK